MKSLFKIFIVLLLGSLMCMAQENVPAYKNTNLSFQMRAKDLVSRMTLKEKVSQIVHDAKAVPRLDIPAYNWMNEALHGVALMQGYVTVFPQSIGMAASFDTDLMYKVGTAVSTEARGLHNSGVRNAEEGYVCGLDFWAPNINLFRDPRWGRGQETYGEDPYLTGRMAVPCIKGLQGNDPKYLKVAATAKHYALYSGPESIRHEFNAVSNDRDFWQSYMPQFVSAVKDANVESVMCAYNSVNGKACCGDSYLLQNILRDKLGFNGYVVSDCGAVSDIYDGHHLTRSYTEAAVLSIKSGVDLNCGRSMTFPFDKLGEAVHEGIVEESKIDTAVYRLMLARFKLGMFDPPSMVPYSNINMSSVDSKEHKALALQMARESIVLLKNKNNLLPLSKNIKTAAVIGPNADAVQVLYGNYNGTPSKPVSVLQGIKDKLPGTKIFYSKGSELIDQKGFENPVPQKFLHSPDKKEYGLRASYYSNTDFSGEPSHTRIETNIALSDEFGAPFDNLKRNNFSVRWEGYISFPETASYKISADGNPYYKIFINEKLISDENSKAKYLTFEGGRLYKIRIDFISSKDEFHFNLAYSADNSALLKNAVEAARKSDAVILVVGLSGLLEGEDLDRNQIELPAIQQTLIKNILRLNKPTVLVIVGGSAIAFDSEILKKVHSIVEAWYPGESGGTAIGDVLFGDYNPAGRLPVTFYKSTSQLPPFKDYSMRNRTYKYFKGQTEFPFGYGLSYTSFKYLNLKMPLQIQNGKEIKISVNVKNTGKTAGDEVVELYVKDLKSSETVPIRKLEGFKRIHLNPGETKTINFILKPKQLAFFSGAEKKWLVEPGEFRISVGGGQPDYDLITTEVLSKSILVEGKNYFINE
jgi:beta-glucosidase